MLPHRAIRLPLLAVFPVCLWLVHSFESFWLDELQTYWVISEGLEDSVVRAFDTQGFTPFYYVLVWAWKQLGFASEAALRLPSLVCVIVAGFGVWKLGQGLFSPLAALAACLVFWGMDDVMDAALFARPYGLALMMSVFSCLCLNSWLSSGKRRYQYLYLLCSVLTVYAHYLFAGLLLLQWSYVFFARERAPIMLRSYLITLLYQGIGCLPLLPQLRLMLHKRAEMQIAPDAGFFDLMLGLLPWISIITLVLSFLFALAVTRHKDPVLKPSDTKLRAQFVLLLLWTLLPPLILFIAGYLLGNSIFVSRYYLWATPGFALLVGYYVNRMTSARLQGYFAGFLVLFTLGAEFSKTRVFEDWRAASKMMRTWQSEENGVSLLYSGVAESARSAWLMDKIKRGQFSSPLTYYGLGNKEVLILPLYVAQAEMSDDYWQREVIPQIQGKSVLYLLCLDNLLWRDGANQKRICAELPELLEQQKFSIAEAREFGRVHAVKMQGSGAEEVRFGH